MTRAPLRTCLTLLVALASGCGTESARTTPLRLGFDLWPGYYPAFVAKESGWLDSAKVPVEIDVPENTGELLAGFASGRYDIVAASVADLVPVLSRLPDARIVMCTDESAGADALIAKPGVRTVSALRGQRIGVKIGGFAELFVRHALYTAGVASNEVQLIDVDASQVGDALSRGVIDAGQTWEPYLGALRAEGVNVLYSSEQVTGLIVECLFVREELVTGRARELRGLIDAWFRGQQLLVERPDSALALVARAIGRDQSTLTVRGIRFLDRPENLRRFGSSDSLPSLRATIRDHQEFFGSIGLLRLPVDVDHLLDGRFLP